MKRINEIVVVEGKTDSQLLKELYDVDTIETHGLGLDEKTLELIKEASKTRGVIVLTDPDYPGLKIRNQVEKYVQNCKHAFVDRKDAIGRKKLGIAEANKEAVKKAIEKSDDSRKDEILEKIANETFMLKQTSKNNAYIPYQMQKDELIKILDHQEKYYPVLKENRDKIISILEFRIPYYYGPLNGNEQFGWLKRKKGKEKEQKGRSLKTKNLSAGRGFFVCRKPSDSLKVSFLLQISA